LDYSITRVKKKDGQNAGDKWGSFNLRHGGSIFKGQRVNIIQHPQGRFKEIAFRDNQVKAVEDNFIQYITDTDYGSSGSPVFDDYFNVVALHNQRVRDPNAPDRWYRNQGFRVEAILADAGGLIP
jgi:endonuclease G